MSADGPRQLSVLQLVPTHNFAGVERYVCQTSSALTERQVSVTVIGGDPGAMTANLPPAVRWLPAVGATQALRQSLRVPASDVLHVHMTAAESVGLVLRGMRCVPVVSTRHFARHRGSNAASRAVSVAINHWTDRQLAISDYVAGAIERPPHAVLRLGTPPNQGRYQAGSRLVLVQQRLESEKDTLLALRIWALSGLHREGWRLRVVGTGAQREFLQGWVADNSLAHSVDFAGWSSDVAAHLAAAALLLASAPAEPLGLSVVEAMAAGVPVVATAAGGHLETVGAATPEHLFPRGDAPAGARALRLLAVDEELRLQTSQSVRAFQVANLSLDDHVTRLLETYRGLAQCSRRGSALLKRNPSVRPWS